MDDLVVIFNYTQIRCADWFYGSEGRESTEADRECIVKVEADLSDQGLDIITPC